MLHLRKNIKATGNWKTSIITLLDNDLPWIGFCRDCIQHRPINSLTYIMLNLSYVLADICAFLQSLQICKLRLQLYKVMSTKLTKSTEVALYF